MLSNILAIPANPGMTVSANGNTNQLSGVNPNGIPLEQGLAVGACSELAVDVTVTSGSCQFFVDRLGLDGNWYQIANSGSVSGSYSTTLAGQNSASQAFGETVRLRWAPSGSATFSASIIGK